MLRVLRCFSLHPSTSKSISLYKVIVPMKLVVFLLLGMPLYCVSVCDYALPRWVFSWQAISVVMHELGCEKYHWETLSAFSLLENSALWIQLGRSGRGNVNRSQTTDLELLRNSASVHTALRKISKNPPSCYNCGLKGENIYWWVFFFCCQAEDPQKAYVKITSMYKCCFHYWNHTASFQLKKLEVQRAWRYWWMAG